MDVDKTKEERMNNFIDLINKVKKQAKEAGLKITEGDIAKKLGIEQETLSRLKGGKSELTEKHITALKRAIPEIIPGASIEVDFNSKGMTNDLIQIKATVQALNSVVAELLAKDQGIDKVEAMGIIQEKVMKYLIDRIRV